jgi:hypothetical protein
MNRGYAREAAEAEMDDRDPAGNCDRKTGRPPHEEPGQDSMPERGAGGGVHPPCARAQHNREQEEAAQPHDDGDDMDRKCDDHDSLSVAAGAGTIACRRTPGLPHPVRAMTT